MSGSPVPVAPVPSVGISRHQENKAMKKSLLMYTNVAIFCVILLGFGVASFQSYELLLRIKKNDIENISALTADGIYSNNAILIASPVQMSLAMAHDTFLLQWLHAAPDSAQSSPEHIDK